MSRRLAALLALVVPLHATADEAESPPDVDDAGILLHVDLATFELGALDLDTAAIGPTLRVSIGTPSYPTPTGEFRPTRVIENPSWTPGPVARSLGARDHEPSSESPLGVGKLPLEFGAIQIHAGADPLLLGKPSSLGCVSLDDKGWSRLIEWLGERGSLHPARKNDRGEVESGFRRPVRVVVR